MTTDDEFDDSEAVAALHRVMDGVKNLGYTEDQILTMTCEEFMQAAEEYLEMLNREVSVRKAERDEFKAKHQM